jgi:chaperonin GroEL
VRKALSAPARQIAINAGEDGSVIVGKILEKDQYAYGFDSQTGEYGNLVAKGIIDPTKVGSDNQLGDFRFSHEFQTSR